MTETTLTVEGLAVDLVESLAGSKHDATFTKPELEDFAYDAWDAVDALLAPGTDIDADDYGRALLLAESAVEEAATVVAAVADSGGSEN